MKNIKNLTGSEISSSMFIARTKNNSSNKNKSSTDIW